MEETYACGQCDKQIDVDEYVVNWGWCAPCLDASFAQYFRKERIRYVGQRAAVWVGAAALTTLLFLGGGKVVGTVLYYLSHTGQ